MDRREGIPLVKGVDDFDPSWPDDHARFTAMRQLTDLYVYDFKDARTRD
jgi:hypothetical protein